MLDLCLLGTGGMMPMPNRFLTALLARLNGKMLLIDCGEGTQVTMKLLGWGFKNIDCICFTHYHGDHISGLPGLLLTIGNAGRTEPLTLVGPAGLQYVVEGLRRIAPELPFQIIYREMEKEQDSPIQVGEFTIHYCKADHMVPCYSYKIEVKRRGKFQPQKAKALGLPKELWGVLQKQGSVVWNGNVYEQDMVMGEARKSITASYCTDTRPVSRLKEFIKGSQLLICEGMYGEDEKKDKAIAHKHMLFSEAARLAKYAEVEKLWLTHYSPALSEPEAFLEAAKRIFPETELGEDRKNITLFFPEA